MEKLLGYIKNFKKVFRESESQFSENIKKCRKLCLDEKPKDKDKMRQQMNDGLREVSKTVNKLTIIEKLSDLESVLLFWSCLALTVHFMLDFRRTERLSEEINMRKSKGFLTSFLLYYLSTEPNEENLMQWFFKFWNSNELWAETIIMVEILRELLRSGVSYDIMTLSFLRHVMRLYVRQDEELLKNVAKSMEMMFRSVKYSSSSHNIKCLSQLHNMYHSFYSSRNFSSIDSMLCESILKCLIAFTSHITDLKGLCHNVDITATFIYRKALTPTEVYELGQALCLATSRYPKLTYSISLTENVSTCILHMINSTDKKICSTGYLLFKHILDRHNNKSIFKNARLYKRNLLRQRYDLKKCEPSKDEMRVDGNVFNNLNYALHEVITESILRFNDPEILNQAYVCICLMVFEVKSHTVAINAIHISMTLQEAILREQKKPKPDLELCARFHSYIISIMSFICYEHDEDCITLSMYIDSVINARKQRASYLLPSLSGKISKIEGPTAMESDVYLDPAEIHLAIQQSWCKYRFQQDYIFTDMWSPPQRQSMDEIFKLKDDGVTTYDTLIVDEFGSYLKSVPLEFGVKSKNLRTPAYLKGPTYRPGHSFLLRELPAISEYFDRFHFYLDLRTPIPTKSGVVHQTIPEELVEENLLSIQRTKLYTFNFLFMRCSICGPDRAWCLKSQEKSIKDFVHGSKSIRTNSRLSEWVIH